MLIDGEGGGAQGGAGVGGNALALDSGSGHSQEESWCLGLLARTGDNFGEVALWDCAKCSMELRSYHRAGNCFPQMCLKLSFRQLSFLGGNGLGGWEWHA